MPTTPGAGGSGLTPPEPAPNPIMSYALAPLHGAAPDRDPQTFKRELGQRFEVDLAALRKAREAAGGVLVPEDTHALIRRLYAIRSFSEGMREAFAGLTGRVDDALGEELIEAVGDEKGIPNRSMTVPHDGELIKLAPEFQYLRDYALDQIFTGLVFLIEAEWAEQGMSPHEDPHGFALAVVTRAVEQVIGSNGKPKSTAVEALARNLGNRGDDAAASAVRRAVHKRAPKFRKVKVDAEPAA